MKRLAWIPPGRLTLRYDPSLSRGICLQLTCQTHGTGFLKKGDSEADSICRVFGENNISVGSAKSKLGNNEGAAGITSVIKALLSLERRIIPQSIRPSSIGQTSMIFRQYHQIGLSNQEWQAHQPDCWSHQSPLLSRMTELRELA